MNHAKDDLDSSDDEDHFPPSQALERGGAAAAKNKMIGAGASIIGQSKAAKFDKLLQKGAGANGQGKSLISAQIDGGVKLHSVLQSSGE